MTYTLTVSNNGTATGDFVLTDEIVVQAPVTAAITTPAAYDAASTDSTTETPNGAFDAGLGDPGDTSVASGTTDAGAIDVFTYTITFTVPAGDELAQLDECELAMGTPVVTNTATVNVDIEDEECVDLPQLDIDKSSVLVDNGDGTVTVAYSLEVTNSGTASGDYDVTDVVSLVDGVSIVSVTDPVYGGETDGLQGILNTGFDATSANSTVVSGESLAAGSRSRLGYSVTFAIDPDVFEVGANPCGPGDVDVPIANVAELSTGGVDEECNDVPVLDIVKSAAPFVDNGDGTYTVTYTLTVSNIGTAAAVGYGVSDSIDTGAGVLVGTVSEPTYGGEPDGLQGTLNQSFDRALEPVVVAGEALAAAQFETFVYSVVYTTDPTARRR